MGANSAEYEIRLKDNFSRTLDKAEARLNRFEKKLKDVNKTAQAFGKSSGGGGGMAGGGGGSGFHNAFGGSGAFGTGWSGMFKGMVAHDILRSTIQGIQNLTRSVITLGGEIENTRISFRAMLNSRAEGDQAIKSLRTFAVETPYSQREVLTGAKQMLAYGFKMEGMTDNLRMLGDVAAGLNLRLDDLVFVYGTLRAQGRAYAIDLRQFALRGIPIYEALEATLGKTGEQIKKMTKDGDITFKTVENAFKYMTQQGSMFGGLMEKRSQSYLGRVEKLKDKFEILWADFGEKSVNPMLGGFVDFLSSLLPSMQSLNDAFKQNTKGHYERRNAVNTLADEFERLSKIENRSVEENRQLKKVTEELVQLVPTAVTGWNAIGEAIGINTQKLREFNFESNVARRQQKAAAQKDMEYQLWRKRNLLPSYLKSLETGDDYVGRMGDFGRKKLTPLQLDQYGDMREDLMADIQELKNQLYESYGASLGAFGEVLGLDAVPKEERSQLVKWLRQRKKETGASVVDTEDSEEASGLERIQAQTRNVNVTIGSLIAGDVKFESFEKNEMDLVKLVSRALVSAVNDVNMTANA